MNIKKSEHMRKVALEYIKMNLPIIECDSKIPKKKGWNNVIKTDPEEVKDWFLKFKFPGIGLVLGGDSRIVGIDIDGPSAAKLLHEKSQGDLPDTWTYITPGNGMRYLYRFPKGLIAKKCTFTLEGEHSELAFLGAGQQTILPGSFHPNGGMYEWLDGKSYKDLEIADAPAWMVKIMTESSVVNKSKLNNFEGSKLLSESIINYQLGKFTSKCMYCKKALGLQEGSGLPEDEWFRLENFFIACGNDQLAFAFSKKSKKHDKRSQERIEKLINERTSADKKYGPAKCTSLGCSENQISLCFGSAKKGDDGDLHYSPSIFLNTVTKIVPPELDVYKDYLQALQDIDGVYLDENGRVCVLTSEGTKKVIANFILRIVKNIVATDGMFMDSSIIVEGVLEGGRILEPKEVKINEFERLDWLIKAWGVAPVIYSGYGVKDKVREIIQRVSRNTETQMLYKHIGWTKLQDNSLVYLHDKGAVSADNVDVKLDSSLKCYSFPPRVLNIKEAIGSSLKILKTVPLRISIPLLALVFISPLVYFFQQADLSPNFIIWLYGRTGSRKTALSLAMLSHFGYFNSPPASFKDTANFIEKKAHMVKDSLLLIDDFHPNGADSEVNLMAKTAERAIRIYGDRVARGRLTSTTEFQETYVPRGMALVTGEDIPAGQSANARFLALELLAGDVNLENLTFLQNNRELLNQSMLAYIGWLQKNSTKLPEFLKNNFYKKRSDFFSENVHGRLTDTAAYLEVAFSLFLTFARKNKAISEKRYKKLKQIAHNLFKKAIINQSEVIVEQKPEKIFMDTLNELINSNKVYLLDKNSPDDNSLIIGGGNNHIGFYDDKFYYLYPLVAYTCVNILLSKNKKMLPVTEKILWKNLADARMIQIESSKSGNNQNLRKVTVPSTKKGEKVRMRLLHIHKEFLEI
jgi:hypothetical protein